MRQLPVSRALARRMMAGAAPVRVMLMARSLGDYTRLLFYPANLHMERTILDATGYQNNASWRSGAGIEYLSLLGLATLAALGGWLFRRGKGQAVRIFGAAWFFGGLPADLQPHLTQRHGRGALALSAQRRILDVSRWLRHRSARSLSQSGDSVRLSRSHRLERPKPGAQHRLGG